MTLDCSMCGIDLGTVHICTINDDSNLLRLSFNLTLVEAITYPLQITIVKANRGIR